MAVASLVGEEDTKKTLPRNIHYTILVLIYQT